MPIKDNPTRLADVAYGRTDMFKIDPRIIKIDPNHSPRDFSLPENILHIEELKESIRESGVLIPLIVRHEKSQPIIVDGESRLRASMGLIDEGFPLKNVPCIQYSSGNTPAERLIVALSTNTGKLLSQWESGNAFSKLIKYGETEEMIAQCIGRRVAYVKDCIQLSQAPSQVKVLLSNGSITPALAVNVLNNHGDSAANVLQKQVDFLKANAPAGTVIQAKRPSIARSTYLITSEAKEALKKLIIAGMASKDLKVVALARKAKQLVQWKI